MMKIIIAYASAGSGHLKVAKAIYNSLKTEYPDSGLTLIDALDKTNPIFKKGYSCGYKLAIGFAPALWGLGFRLTSAKYLRPAVSCLRFMVNRFNARGFARFLIRENPDFVISTHFLASEVSGYLKKRGEIKSGLVTVITDFGAHPFWISACTDLYAVASAFTRDCLLREGIPQDRIKETGIPQDESFCGEYDQKALRRKFGLKQDVFTVLIVTGSFGIGPIEQITGLIHRHVQVLAVCANNRKLFLKLTRKNYPGVRVFGFVDNMPELMAASDIIVTKPGGSTVSELLAMELVPVFIYPIPGQETGNMETLARYGIGRHGKRVSDVRDIVMEYKEHPGLINDIRARIRLIKKPRAARELSHALRSSSFRPAC